jgi:hypothetical protein
MNDLKRCVDGWFWSISDPGVICSSYGGGVRWWVADDVLVYHDEVGEWMSGCDSGLGYRGYGMGMIDGIGGEKRRGGGQGKDLLNLI